MKTTRRAFLGALLLALSGCRKQPEVPLELHLELARKEWRLGEQPWYRLTLKNVGIKEVIIHDAFWADQYVLSRNSSGKEGTYFDIQDPSGAPMRPSFFWGMHGEYAFWANDCDGRPCEMSGSFFYQLKPGKKLVATPSITAPIRKQGRYAGLTDARIPPGTSPGERQAYRKLWALQAERVTGSSLTLGGFDPDAPPPPEIPGFRILEGYRFTKPGFYSMRAIFVAITPETIEWLKQKGLWRPGGANFPPETKEFRFESNRVEFEVVP